MKLTFCRLILTVLFAVMLVLAGCQMPQSCLDGDSFSSTGELEKAVDSYMECMAQSNASESSVTGQKVKELKKKISLKQVEEAEAKIQGGKTVPVINDLIAQLKSKEKYDTPEGLIKNKLGECEIIKKDLEDAISELLAKAENAVLSEDWDMALKYIDDAKVYYPDGKKIVSAYEATLKKRDSFYSNKIAKACDQDNYEEAFVLLDQWAVMPSPEAKIDIEKMKVKVFGVKDKVINARVDEYMAQNKFYSAFTVINESGLTSLGKKMDIIKDKGSEFYKNLAYKEKANVYDFHAYVAAYKALQLNPNDDEIFELFRDCEDKVDESLRVIIGFDTFEFPKDDPDVGREISDMLNSKLLDMMPYGFSIDERKKMEFSKEQTGAMQEAVVLQGVEYALFGSVSRLEINSKTNENHLKVKVKVGEEEVPNPQYLAMITAYGHDTSRWPSVPTEILKSESYELVDCRSGTDKIEILISVSARIYSTALGELVKSDNFTVNQLEEDTFKDPLPDAGIEADPRDMKVTEIQLSQQVKEQVVEKIAKWVMDYFVPREKYFSDTMENHIKRREFELAVQYAVQGFQYCRRSDIADGNEWYDNLMQKCLFELTEGESDRY